jgi:hypothetical protein
MARSGSRPTAAGDPWNRPLVGQSRYRYLRLPEITHQRPSGSHDGHQTLFSHFEPLHDTFDELRVPFTTARRLRREQRDSPEETSA